ncbi:MAG: FAD-dependent monooxygenase, partial [Sphingomonadaceae bacterium]|nr:FAD-dependent monooxygenase [Sphingomonadaceae bacterium]
LCSARAVGFHMMSSRSGLATAPESHRNPIVHRYTTVLTQPLRRDCEATGLVEEDGRVRGVQLAEGGTVRAQLTIAADGRQSVLGRDSALPLIDLGAPMDVFWFRIPKLAEPKADTLGVFAARRVIVFIDRGDYYQCAFVFTKGTADSIREMGIETFRERVRSAAPDMAAGVDAIRSWDDVKLLTVAIDRLQRWSRPGLLVIGDAAHAMSPMGGVGINLAVQDAVAAANILAGPMAAGVDPDPLLGKVQERRMPPTRRTQGMQVFMQNSVVAPLLKPGATLDKAPLAARALDAIPLLRRIPGRIVGLGFRPEHIRSPEA